MLAWPATPCWVRTTRSPWPDLSDILHISLSWQTQKTVSTPLQQTPGLWPHTCPSSLQQNWVLQHFQSAVAGPRHICRHCSDRRSPSLGHPDTPPPPGHTCTWSPGDLLPSPALLSSWTPALCQVCTWDTPEIPPRTKCSNNNKSILYNSTLLNYHLIILF